MTFQTNSQVFLNELAKIAGAYTGNEANPGIANGLAVMPNQTLFGQPTQFIGPTLSASLNPNNFNSGNTTDMTSFVNNFYTELLNYPSTSQIPATAYDPTNPGGLLNGLYTGFQFIMANNTNLNLVQDTNQGAQFNALFTDFIKHFPFSILTTSATTTPLTVNGLTYQVSSANNYQNFIAAFYNYLKTTTVVQTASTANVLNPANFTNSAGVSYIQSFQKIYEAFNGPVGTLSTNSASWTVAQKVYVQRLTNFYNAELKKTATTTNPAGFFDPSQDLGDWFNFTQRLYYNPSFNPAAILANPHSTIILDQVLLSLINMIGTIQTVAAAQANSLNFLSQWQQTYTNKLNQIHTFAQGDGTAIGTFTNPPIVGGNNNWDQNGAQATRNALNNINQNYISKLQANQQTISDNAKSLQSNVNQSNDAANQQGSLADSVLQELNTILSSIFR